MIKIDILIYIGIYGKEEVKSFLYKYTINHKIANSQKKKPKYLHSTFTESSPTMGIFQRS